MTKLWTEQGNSSRGQPVQAVFAINPLGLRAATRAPVTFLDTPTPSHTSHIAYGRSLTKNISTLTARVGPGANHTETHQE